MARQLSAHFDEFLTWLAVEKGRSARTLSAYSTDLRRYSAWLSERNIGLNEVREDDVLAYIGYVTGLGLAPATVKRSVVTVRGLHRFLAVEGELTFDAGAQVASPRVPDPVPKALSEQQVQRLLDSVVGEGPRVLRDRAMLEVLYGTGLRISELVGLSLSDLDLDQRLLRAFGKGAKERIVPIGRIATEALVEWLDCGRGELVPTRWAYRGDDVAVFLSARGRRITRQGAWQMLKKYATLVELGEITSPHVLRHSCATHMLEHGADIRIVQEMLGHASISSTQRYTRISQSHLRKVYQQAHPRAKLVS